MSQAGNFLTSGVFPPGSVVQTLEGNTGGPVGPDGANNINVVGDGVGVTVVGTPGSNTLTISLLGGGLAIDEIEGDTGITVIPTGAGLVNIIAGTSTLNAGSTVSFDGTANTLTLNVSSGQENTLIGAQAGNATITGTYNTSLGINTGSSLTSGGFNILLGALAGNHLTSGQRNIIIGIEGASAYTSSESDNIIIGLANGTPLESNTLRIGDGTGPGAGQLNRAFISGIDGVNVGSVATVVTESGDQLGTAVITAGTGITITPGANLITIAASGTLVLGYTAVSTSPYVVLVTDNFLSVDSSGGAITVRLPNVATLGVTYVVKDRTGSAGTNAITVTTVGGAVNIDGATTFVMNTNYQAISIIGNGSTYEIF